MIRRGGRVGRGARRTNKEEERERREATELALANCRYLRQAAVGRGENQLLPRGTAQKGGAGKRCVLEVKRRYLARRLVLAVASRFLIAGCCASLPRVALTKN